MGHKREPREGPWRGVAARLSVEVEADRDTVEPRSIWIIRDAGGLILKRVTVEDGFVVLESDNRHPEFAPRVLHVSKKERHRTLVGRVVWHAAELA